MKENAQMKVLLTTRSFKFLLMAIAFWLFVIAAKNGYEVGKEIGTFIYYFTH